jgi:hypothetical protein
MSERVLLRVVELTYESSLDPFRSRRIRLLKYSNSSTFPHILVSARESRRDSRNTGVRMISTLSIHRGGCIQVGYIKSGVTA